MNIDEYCSHDATGLANLVRRRAVSSRELIELARTAYLKVNPAINAVVEFYHDAEQLIDVPDGPFSGVPFLRKDIGATEEGRLQECGSRLLKGNIAQADSHYTRRAKSSGLRLVGRTAVPEFGVAGFTESLLEGITRNPWSLEHSAGGSSGGAAAAVAAGIVPIAHASDAGGSIRIPAGWCGQVGFNPSRGRISGGPDGQDYLFGLARQFVICKTVRDVAMALDVFSGPEPGDPFVIQRPDRPYVQEMGSPTPKLRIGFARKAWGALSVASDVEAILDDTAILLGDMGHSVELVEPLIDDRLLREGVFGAFNLGLTDLPILAASLGKPLDETTIEPVVLKLMRDAQQMSPLEIMGVFEALRKIRHDVAIASKDFDILLTPTTPITAPEHGRYSTTRTDLSAVQFAKGDTALFAFLSTFNVTGQPSVSLPVGLSGSGMPIGIQIVGRFADEATLIRIARDIEEARPWSCRRPAVHAALG
ncbi:amidase [Rhizobium herbae]